MNLETPPARGGTKPTSGHTSSFRARYGIQSPDYIWILASAGMTDERNVMHWIMLAHQVTNPRVTRHSTVDLFSFFLYFGVRVRMADKTIVILGAGIGGIVTARELRRHLGVKHRIILIDRSATHSFPPSYLWVMVGWRKPTSIQRPISLLGKYGIEFIQSTIHSIDVDRRVVAADGKSFNFDYLVIALGSELVPQKIPGLAQANLSNYTLEGAQQIFSRLSDLSQRRITIVVASMPYKCPPAPYETAFLLKSYFTRKSRLEISIDVFTPEAAPLEVAGPPIGSAISKLLQQSNVGLHCSEKLVEVEPRDRTLRFESGRRIPYDLLIAVPPHEAPTVIREAGLTDETGWIPVDKASLKTRHENVFAIGDSVSLPLVSGLFLPKAGVFAHSEAEVVAFNIAMELSNAGRQKRFTGVGHCFLETGDGKAAYISGNFLVGDSPALTFNEPSVTYHWGKVLYERYWLWRWF